MSELHLILFTLGSTSLIVVTSAFIALRWIFRRGWKNKGATPTPIGIGILACGAAVVSCFLYSLLVEPYWLDISHIKLQSTKIPIGTKGFRVAHISDIHSDPAARLEEKLPSIIAAEKPDLIVLTGDCINSPEGLPVFKKFISETSQIAPTFVVKGNWDAWYWDKINLFDGSSAIPLKGVQELTPNGIPVTIVGFPVSEGRDPNPEGGVAAVEHTLSKLNKANYSIFLYHYPDLIEEVEKHQVDLYCAGHTHGGQVRLPLYGALVTLSKFGKKYEAGLYKVRNTSLYVSRGVGMEGSIAPRIRFLCRPELAIIDVEPASKQ